MVPAPTILHARTHARTHPIPASEEEAKGRSLGRRSHTATNGAPAVGAGRPGGAPMGPENQAERGSTSGKPGVVSLSIPTPLGLTLDGGPDVGYAG